MNKRKGIQIEDLLSKFNELRKSTQVLCELHVNCVNIYKEFSVVLFFLKKFKASFSEPLMQQRTMKT